MAAAAVYDSASHSAQQQVKIKSFDPSKAEDFNIWEETLFSLLSKRAQTAVQKGRPTYEDAICIANINYGGNPTAAEIDSTYNDLHDDYLDCEIEVWAKVMHHTRWSDSATSHAAFETIQRKFKSTEVDEPNQGIMAFQWMKMRFDSKSSFAKQADLHKQLEHDKAARGASQRDARHRGHVQGALRGRGLGVGDGYHRSPMPLLASVSERGGGLWVR